jgi:palmitoyltransferase
LNFELQALSVFILYVRCTAIDPADVGVVPDCDKTSKNISKLDEELAG